MPRSGEASAAPGSELALPRDGGSLRALLRRDRAVLLTGMLVLAGAAWAYTAHLAGGMSRMGAETAMPLAQPWSRVDLVVLWIMWAVMMVAMMLPSAAPMILLFASVQRRRRMQARPDAPTAVFVLGYLLVWALYSAAATLAQWALHEASLLSPLMVSTSAVLGGGLLVGAGLFQFTPLKRTCLSTCRSPLGFLGAEWREGARGALVMGIRHGSYCVGCCWALMALLFVAGVMNLLWVAVIAAFALLEKLAPRGEWISRAAGAVLVAAGALMWGSAP